MIKEKKNDNLFSSFRDPSGFVFFQRGVIFRQVNISYKNDYDHLIKSGLYKELIDSQLLIPHKEIDINYKKSNKDFKRSDKAYKIIKPEPIEFISYPYEWSFSQLKDAALTTLTIQKKSLEFTMSLKDCSGYNIQFKKGKPIFIDTISFEKYQEGIPWVAYRQFCQHFLAPLALMSYKDIRLNQLLRVYIDGIPLDLASSLLPFYTRLKPSLLLHLHFHAKSQKYFANKKLNKKTKSFTRQAFLGLIDNLETTIKKMNWQPRGTEWAEYYDFTNYSPGAINQKKEIIDSFLAKVKPKTVWDLGANIGTFSRLSSNKGIPTISFDIDPACVEKNYLECRKNEEINILPLVIDLTNPSPAIGWENNERMSFLERGPADTVLALALIHHLAISNNLPFVKIASFFRKISE